MIRNATAEDLEYIGAMFFRFITSTPYLDYFTPVKVATFLLNFLDSPDHKIFYEDKKGFLMAAKAQFIFGDVWVAHEVAWWVEPEYRGTNVGSDLLKVFEDWARSENCKLINMVCLDDVVGAYYDKKGYTKYERSYMKGI